MELLERDEGLEAFADPAFDCYAWVEEALVDAGGDVGALAALVPQLALRAQALAKQIHAALHQLALSGPALEAQLAAMQQAAGPLAVQLDAAHAEIAASSRQQRRERDLEQLVALHEAKQRLAACQQALVEAARWGRNARTCAAYVDDPAFMDSGPPAQPRRGKDKPLSLSECVREMRASLKVGAACVNGAGAVANWELWSRCSKTCPARGTARRPWRGACAAIPAHMDATDTIPCSLCTQIESKMKTKLDQILRDEHVDVALLHWCLDVFDSMGRADVVRRAFCKARPAAAHRAWFAFDQSQSADEGRQSFSGWLDGFYGDVQRMLLRESATARELYGDKDAVVSVTLELLENTLSPLAESFRDRLRRDFQLSHTLSAFQSTSSFAVAVVQNFRSLESDGSRDSFDASLLASSLTGLSLSAATSLGKEHGPHSSEDTGTKLLVVIFEPFRAIFDDFTQFASNALTDQLLRLAPSFVKRPERRQQNTTVDDDDDDDYFMDESADDGLLEAFAQKLEDASGGVWAVIEESLQQCYMFSAGAAFPEAVEAVGAAVQQFSLALTSSIPAMRKFCNAEISENDAVVTASAADVGSATMAPPDWSKFHGALALLRACGALESDLAAMENRVRSRMREQLATFIGIGSGTNGASSPRSRRKKSHDASGLALTALVDPLQVSAAVARLWLRENPTRLSQLQQFAHAQTDADTLVRKDRLTFVFVCRNLTKVFMQLFDDAQRAVHAWTHEAQRLTFDAVFRPIARVLEALPVLEVWRSTPEGDNADDLPTFSALPQEYITVVADRLLSLLPQLEPFAESAGLRHAFLASRGAHDACVQDEWQRLGQLLRLSPQETLECQHSLTPEDEDDLASATAFVDLWTGAVASGALAALLRAVCLISELSDTGSQQLSADLAYFFNVLNAVGGDGSFLVDDLRTALSLSPAEHAQRVAELRAETDEPRKQVLAKLHDCVAAKRQRQSGDRQTTQFY